MGRRSSVDGLPADVRKWLERALVENNFTGYQQLEEVLRGRGYSISKSALHRFGKKIEDWHADIKEAAAAAQMMVTGAQDDQDALSESLLAMTKTELMNIMINLRRGADSDKTPEERIALLSAAAKNIATLTRASVSQKKFRHEVEEDTRRKLLAEQGEKLKTLAGVSDATRDAIRVALGIV